MALNVHITVHTTLDNMAKLGYMVMKALVGRRGKKRAIVAVGHTMLVMMRHMLKEEVDYQELGHDYLDKLQPRRLTPYLVKRLEALGHEVSLRPLDRAA